MGYNFCLSALRAPFSAAGKLTFFPAGKEVTVKKIPCLVLFLAALFPIKVHAGVDPAPLEEVSQRNAALQPGLENYQARVETTKFADMLRQMTANMPPELPRPETPVLRKYWDRSTGATLIRAEGVNVFPYMQEMVRRFSAEFAVELRSLFLPASMVGARRALLEGATGTSSETLMEKQRLLTLQISFPAPVDLKGSFYGEGLDLPQRQVRQLLLDIDPERDLLRRLEIVTADGKRVAAEIRYQERKGEAFPQEVRITAPDGSIDDLFVTTFCEVEGFLLPLRQEREISRPDRKETITVSFSEYRVNISIPVEIHREPVPSSGVKP